MATGDPEVEHVGSDAAHRDALPTMPARWVQRERLLSDLDDGLTHAVTLVAAPPGYGKTSLVSAWLRERHRRAVWVTFDPWDDEPTRVLRRILDATPGGMHTEPRPMDDLLLAASRVVERLAEIEPPPILVLDDVDVLVAGPTHDLLRYLLLHLPQAIHAVIITRAEPLYLPLPQWRWSGALTEIRADALAFREDEVEVYVNRCCQLSLPRDDVTRVADRTEGWPGALVLAVAHLAGAQPPTARLLSRGPVFAANLLASALDGVTPSDALFLMQTAILDVLTPSLCRSVTGCTDAEHRLQRLAALGLVQRIDAPASSEHRYRHGRLLRDLLLAELHDREPGSVQALHERAATALAAEGHWRCAVRHAEHAGDDALLALVSSHLLDVIAADGGVTFRMAVAGANAAALAGHQSAMAAHLALSALEGGIDDIERSLSALEIAASPPDELIAAGRLHISRLLGHDVATLDAISGASRTDPLFVGTMGAHRGWEGRHEEAAALLRRALDGVRARSAVPLHLHLLADLCWERVRAGHLLEADLLVGRAVRLSRALALRRLPLAVQLSMTQLALDRGSSHLLEQRLLEAGDLAQATGDRQLQLDWILLSSRATDDPAGADVALHRLQRLRARDQSSSWGSALHKRAAREEANLRLLTGDIEGAITAAPHLAGPAVDTLDSPVERLLRVRLLEAAGETNEAHRALMTLHGAPLPPRVAMDAAAQELRLANHLGGGVDTRHATRTLARVRRAQGFHVPARRSSMQPVAAPKASAGSGTLGAVRPDLVEDLTDRELEVLRSLRSSQPYRELARRLDISVNTLKAHLKSVYRKLGVASRAEARAVADRLGLD